MPTSTPNPATAPALRQRRRVLGLVALCTARQRAAWGARVARVAGWLVAAVFASAIVILWPRLRGALTDLVAVRALAWLSWTASGLAAWSAARDYAALDETEGVLALVRARGFDLTALGRARWAATVATTAHVSLGPALLLVGLVLATARSVPELGARLLFSAAAVLYVLGVAAVLGSVARGAAWLWPKHGRSMLFLLVLGPYLIRHWQAELWSVPSLFAHWLGTLRQIGAIFA